MRVRIRKGLDIPLAGAPTGDVTAAGSVRSVAVVGEEFRGLRPRMLVEPGDAVRLGQPLFTEKRDPRVCWTAPGTGTVVAVNRGPRRVLQSVVIELDADAADAGPAPPAWEPLGHTAIAALAPGAVRERLCEAGLWPALRTRPFDRTPASDSTPRSIFVTAIDTRPLAPDPAPIVAAAAPAFAVGLAVLARLTEGPVWLCTGEDFPDLPAPAAPSVRRVTFDGPHPAGLPGTHIHHLDPVGAQRTVWHVGYQDVIAAGRLFGEGRLCTERVVALGGEGMQRPRLVRTRLGASVADLVDGELRDAGRGLRVLAGSVLDGRPLDAGGSGWLGRFEAQVCAIPEGDGAGLLSWLRAVSRQPSFVGALAHLRRRRAVSLSTALGGTATAMIPIESFERLLPMDMLAVPLLRALLIGDLDLARDLGCLELAPEDLALCSFVCPGKNDYGAVLRHNLEQLEREA